MDMKNKDFTRPVTDEDIKKTAESFLVGGNKSHTIQENIPNKYGDYSKIYNLWQKPENRHKLFTAYEIRDAIDPQRQSLTSRVYEMANKKVNILRYVKKKQFRDVKGNIVTRWQLELAPDLHGVPWENVSARFNYSVPDKKTQFEKLGKILGRLQLEFAMNRHLGVEDRMRIMHDICDILCRMVEFNPTTTVQKDQWLTLPGTYGEMNEYIASLTAGEKATEIIGDIEGKDDKKLWFENEITKRLKGDK